MDFLDIASRYAQNRMDQATQPFTDPNAYMENRLGVGGETEEERRKRLERERIEAERQRALIGNTEVQTQQVKTYADGSQEHTTTQQVPAPVAPVAPPMVEQPVQQPLVQQQAPMAAPVMPEPVQQAPVQQAPVQQPTVPAMVAPGQLHPDHQAAIDKVMPPAMTPAMAPPAPAARPIINDQGQVLGQETPEQMVRGAQSNAPVAPTTMPATAPAQMMPTAAPAATTPKFNVQPSMEQMGPSTQFMGQEGWQDRITTAKTAQDYRKIMADPNTPEEISQLAAGKYAEALSTKREEDKASKIIDAAASGDPKATNDLARAIKSNKEEGSYIKAILFSRLGLNDLAKEEQQKLGGGTGFQSVVGPDGQRYTAIFGGQGEIGQAFDATGRSVDERKLAELNANAIASKGIGHAGATRIRDSSGTEWSVVPTTRGSIFYDNAGRQGTPQGNTVPIGIGSDVELAYKKGFFGAQGTAQGKGAGEGFTPGATMPAPGMPGGFNTAEGWAKANGIPVSAKGGTRTNQEQWDQYDAWVASGRTGPAVARPGTSRHEAGQAIDVPKEGRTPENKRKLEDAGFTNPIKDEPWHYELPKTTTTSGAVIPNALASTSGTSGGGIAAQRQALETAGKRTESFNKIIDTEYRENGQKGEIVSNNRKQQFDILNRVDPTTNKGMAETISGLYNAANENPSNQKLTIVRDILTGRVLPEQDASKRIAELNISPAAKSALQEYNSLNAQIAGQTLRETAGPGSVSDAEQAANKARNVDITKAPMLGAYNMMGQSQFNADLQRYKADLSASTSAPNATAFDRDFRKYQQELIKSYRDVSEARLEYINKNGGANNPNAIRQGYKLFPSPEYDPGTGEWKHKKPLTQIFGNNNGR